MLPRTYEWLKSLSHHEFTELREQVVEAMVTSFVALTGYEKATQFRGLSFVDFSMGILRPGHLNFTVFGSCACLGVTTEGHLFSEDAWKEGFGEMDFHNIDTKAQSTALLVGAGVVSRLCRLDLEG